MEDSEIESLLVESLESFKRRTTAVEDGFDIHDAELLQLRKSCRLLDAASFLQAENGYYTVVIEASFAAIERSVQFYLLHTDLLSEDEYVGHETVYERGFHAGLYDESFKRRLVGLWRNNRSKLYYREGVGTAGRAEAMLELALAVHEHVTQLAGRSHDCICDTE